MQVDIETDPHLQNLVRHVRDNLLANQPVQAYNYLQILDNYLHGLTMDGFPIERTLK